MKYDELHSLQSNFTERDAATGEWKSTFSPPTLDDIADNYEQDARLRDKIQQMLRADDAGKRFYAAVLLWEIDRTKSKDVLEKLTADATSVRVQARTGHSVVETAVGILALDFLTGRQIRGDNFIKEETLSKWATAISAEKRKLKQIFDKSSLPKWKDVLDVREDAGKMERLRIKIDRLRGGGIAERFYAAALLQTIDEGEWRKTLESLLTEKTVVGVLSGDIMRSIPACQVAEKMLAPETFNRMSEPANPIARATEWFEKNLFGKKSGE